MDSPRATGAYRFDIQPGAQTVTTVRARIFGARRQCIHQDAGHCAADQHVPVWRKPAAQGRLRPRCADSERPDGVRASEWLWRRCKTPAVLVTSFATTNPRVSG